MNRINARKRAGTSVAALTLAGALAVTPAVLHAAPAATAQDAPGLLLTEYVEGSSFNKAVEITNTGETAVDLTQYSVHVFSNGNTSSSSTDALTGSLAPGESYVYGSNRAEFPVDQSTGAGLWNGDDAIVLYAGETVVDSFGRVGERPDSAWTSGDVTTSNATLRRIQDAAPDTDPFDGFDPAAQWQAYPADSFDDLGTWGEGTGEPGEPEEPEEPGEPGGPIGSCGDEAVAVGAVQGPGQTSPVAGQDRVVEGVVVGDFQTGGFDGYYVQDAGDGDAATSDGVFIYSTTPDVEVGDTVRVAGEVTEHYGMTQIRPDAVLECGTGAELPAPVELTLPIDDRGGLEAFEGMRTTLATDATIIEAFNYDRYGQIVVSSDRHFQPTNLHAPGSPEAVALAEANAADRLMIDDGRSSQNPDPALHPDGEPFTIDHRFRMGDTLSGVAGVLDYRFDEWAIQPTQEATHATANPRPESHGVEAPLTVASMNVLNYFTTLRSEDSSARGAVTAEDLQRQQDKIVSALAGMDADVVGLMEIENDPEAIETLVGALNARVGEGTYAHVETGRLGTDAITQALIYTPATVTPKGAHRVLDESVDPRFVTSKNRPALAQVFTDPATGEDFSVAVNHLKSKGSACTDLGDPEDPDGQGNCNGVRTNAARALADWMETDEVLAQTEKSMIIGDLNAYAKEDPITALVEAGYVDTIRAEYGDRGYSYVFDGQLGYLDHALASGGMDPFVTDVATWSINADEPDLLDYTTEFKKPAQQEIYAPDVFRSSDHDPVLVGLDLSGGNAGGDDGDDDDNDDNDDDNGSSGFFGFLGSLDLFGSLGS